MNEDLHTFLNMQNEHGGERQAAVSNFKKKKKEGGGNKLKRVAWFFLSVSTEN